MKKFLEEKKRELKFKLAGPGHKLAEGTSAELSTANDPVSASLNAALKRCGKQQPEQKLISSSHKSSTASSSSVGVMEERTKCLTSASASQQVLHETVSPSTSCENILFTCKQMSDEIYPANIWKEKIRSHINDMKSSDPIQASILAIKSLNNEQEVQPCIAILQKYLQNLIEHPNVEKYKLIRLGNANVQKILKMEGAHEFLTAIGFSKQLITDDKEENEEEFLIHCNDNEVDLNNVLKSLKSVDGLILTLHRNFVIMSPDELSVIEDHPDDFYDWTVTDVKREHRARMASLEKSLQFRTRKMRELDGKVSPKLSTDYTFLRVRLPDGFVIQVTFSTKETLKDLREFLNEKIEFLDDFFFLSLPSKSYDISEENKSFFLLNLYPKVMLMVKWKESVEEKRYVLRENI